MKAKSKKFGPRLTVSLTGKDYDTLNALAAKDDVSASWVIRRAIEEYLRRHQKEANPALPSVRSERKAHAEGGTASRQ